jgi:hypothetical protein
LRNAHRNKCKASQATCYTPKQPRPAAALTIVELLSHSITLALELVSLIRKYPYTTHKFHEKNTQGAIIPGRYRVHTQTKYNLPSYIKGKAKINSWGYTPARSYSVRDKGLDKDCKFIDRQWYWLDYASHEISEN